MAGMKWRCGRWLGAAVVCVLMGLSGIAAAAEFATLNGITAARKLGGDGELLKETAGKVIFFAYWGIDNPASCASFPRLTELQNELGKTGKFLVVASHVQRVSPEVDTFLKENAAEFPVIQGFEVPQYKNPGSLPAAFLIDHLGRIVAKGNPLDLYDKAAALVKAAPGLTPVIWGDVEPKKCKIQAKKLASGKEITTVLEELDKLAEKDDAKGQEAKALADAARKYVTDRPGQFTLLAQSDPARVSIELEAFLEQVKGMSCESTMADLHKRVMEDPDVPALAKILREYKEIEAKIMEKGWDTKVEKDVAGVRKDLEKLLKKEDLSSLVSGEAKGLLEQL